MSDISVTGSSVKLISGPKKTLIAGVAITAGQCLYREKATGKMKLTDVDSATAEARNCDGIALNPAAADQPVSFAYQKGSVIEFNSVLTQGTQYLASDTAGGIRPAADAGSGDYIVQVGVATLSTRMQLCINNSGALV